MKRRVLKNQMFRVMKNPEGHLFGYVRRDKFDRKKLHQGVDFQAELNSPIFAPDDCRLINFGFSSSYGYYKLFHCYDNFKNQMTLYYLFIAHLNNDKLSKGVFYKGSIIGYTGMSGNAYGMDTIEKGSHLHLEIRIKKKCGRGIDGRVNPLDYGFLELD